ncbi:MAG: ATP-binding cassette domain-containing protein [Gammaproteobacteria bacterium]|nr:ATP-binding cassette domain-containing protein [Gammaproteobacteria bacterium]
MSSLLEVQGLDVEYRVASGWLTGRGRRLRALCGVDFEIQEASSVGVVGESGCGKSTLARAILALVAPSAGEIRWRGWSIDRSDASRMREMRRELQVVFQDPFGSLDPRMTVGDSIAEAVAALERERDGAVVRKRVAAALSEVGLDPALAGRYPHELSGGQCQRVAIARATVVRPRLLICDEAVSALDVSVQAQIVNLLHDLCRRHRMGLMFISHNLAVVRHLCEEVVVLYLGRVVERAPREALFASPRHPYTQALLAAVPEPDPGAARNARVVAAIDDVSDATAAASGCAFAPRCSLATDRCRSESPPLESAGEGRWVACHRWLESPGGDSISSINSPLGPRITPTRRPE